MIQTIEDAGLLNRDTILIAFNDADDLSVPHSIPANVAGVNIRNVTALGTMAHFVRQMLYRVRELPDPLRILPKKVENHPARRFFSHAGELAPELDQFLYGAGQGHVQCLHKPGHARHAASYRIHF